MKRTEKVTQRIRSQDSKEGERKSKIERKRKGEKEKTELQNFSHVI